MSGYSHCRQYGKHYRVFNPLPQIIEIDWVSYRIHYYVWDTITGQFSLTTIEIYGMNELS